jgi:nucleolar pre-ribosomal-associated protein 2
VSESRNAQEALQVLEKQNAPFEEQIIQATRFIGTDIKEINKFIENTGKGSKWHVPIYYAKEEWLLRWLLKRLSAPKDDAPR